MPHAWIEVSANIAKEPEVGRLAQTIYDSALTTGLFPIGGIRVRFQEIAQVIVGDGHPDNAFVHVVLRIGAGRPLATKKAAADEIFAQLKDLMAPLAARKPLAVAFEVQEMSEDLNYKFNNLHEKIAERNAK